MMRLSRLRTVMALLLPWQWALAGEKSPSKLIPILSPG